MKKSVADEVEKIKTTTSSTRKRATSTRRATTTRTATSKSSALEKNREDTLNVQAADLLPEFRGSFFSPYYPFFAEKRS